MIVDGKAWVFGDNINTDLLAPGHAMRLEPREMAKHTLSAINPDFASTVKAGDVIVAGDNFGCGSSREQAAISLSVLGIGAVVARSFARIFFRNAVNVGLPVVTFSQVEQVCESDRIKIDLETSRLWINEALPGFAIPRFDPIVVEIISSGGLMEVTKRKLEERSNL